MTAGTVYARAYRPCNHPATRECRPYPVANQARLEQPLPDADALAVVRGGAGQRARHYYYYFFFSQKNFLWRQRSSLWIWWKGGGDGDGVRQKTTSRGTVREDRERERVRVRKENECELQRTHHTTHTRRGARTLSTGSSGEKIAGEEKKKLHAKAGWCTGRASKGRSPSPRPPRRVSAVVEEIERVTSQKNDGRHGRSAAPRVPSAFLSKASFDKRCLFFPLIPNLNYFFPHPPPPRGSLC